jgi:polyphosphate kinase
VGALRQSWTRPACASSATAAGPAAGTWLDQHFREQIFPVLTPQAIGSSPLPLHPEQGLSLIFELKGAHQRPRADHGAAEPAAFHPDQDTSRYRAGNADQAKDRLSLPKVSVAAGRRVAFIRDSVSKSEAEDLAVFPHGDQASAARRVVRLGSSPTWPKASCASLGLDAQDASLKCAASLA